MFLELLKSFGLGVGMLIISIVGVVAICFALYWIERVLEAIFGKLPKVPEHITNWLVSIGLIIFFLCLTTSLGYAIRHDI